MDSSKAFAKINRHLLLAKLHAYRFSKQALTVYYVAICQTQNKG